MQQYSFTTWEHDSFNQGKCFKEAYHIIRIYKWNIKFIAYKKPYNQDCTLTVTLSICIHYIYMCVCVCVYIYYDCFQLQMHFILCLAIKLCPLISSSYIRSTTHLKKVIKITSKIWSIIQKYTHLLLSLFFNVYLLGTPLSLVFQAVMDYGNDVVTRIYGRAPSNLICVGIDTKDVRARVQLACRLRSVMFGL